MPSTDISVRLLTMIIWNLVSWLLPRNAAYAFAFVCRKAAGT